MITKKHRTTGEEVESASPNVHPLTLNNPFRRMLFGGHWPWLRYLIVHFVYLALIFTTCSMRQLLVMPGNDVGLLQDYFMWTLIFVLPLVVVGLHRVFLRFDEFCDRCVGFVIVDEGHLYETPEELRKELDTIRAHIGLETDRGRFWYRVNIGVFSLVFFISMVVIPVLKLSGARSWAVDIWNHPWGYAVAVPWSFIWAMVLANAVWYMLSIAANVYRFLRKIASKDDLRIIPVAPDGNGGMGSVGQLSYAISLLASVGGIGVVVWVLLFGIDAYIWTGLIIYTVLLICLFFLPLSAVHHSMLRAKDRALVQLSNLFRAVYRDLDSPLGDTREARVNEVAPHTMVLANLEQLYSRAERMPVWPFESTVVGRFVVLMTIPYIFSLVQEASGNLITERIQMVLKSILAHAGLGG